MPIGTRPNKTYEYVLESDRDLPENEQPTFIINYASLGASQDSVNLILSISKLSDGDIASMLGLIEQLKDIIADSLTGWRNMGEDKYAEFPATKQQLKDILRGMLSMEEAMELAGAISQQGVTPEDKKKSESPLPLDTAPSAKPAKDEASVTSDQEST